MFHLQANWILEQNCEPFCKMLALLAGTRFDTDDEVALAAGLPKTDYEAGSWFSYEFSGNTLVRLQVACDVGSCVVFVRVETATDLEREIKMIVGILQEYILEDGHRPCKDQRPFTGRPA